MTFKQSRDMVFFSCDGVFHQLPRHNLANGLKKGDTAKLLI